MKDTAHYFAASNTESGFVSYFDENLRSPRADRCYIIKGGPGTGKSRLMRELGNTAEGMGGAVEYFFCSSDPDSLDGIFVTLPDGNTVSVLDGTAPHGEDIRIPGAVDEIIDLGAFWRSGELLAKSEEITLLGKRKSAAYFRAYRSLCAAGALRRAADSIAESCTDIDGIRRAAVKAVADLSDVSAVPEVIRTPLEAISMKGYAVFDSFREGAKKVFTLTDGRGIGISHLFTSACLEAAKNRGGVCRVSPDPLCSDRVNGIRIGMNSVVCRRLPDSNRSAGESDGMDVSEFFDRDAFRGLREEYSGLRKLQEAAMTTAYEALADAARSHFALEKIYGAAMNFDEKEKFCASLPEKIFYSGR